MAKRLSKIPRWPGALSPRDAVKAFGQGQVVELMVSEVINLFGMTAEEFLPYLQSGEITGYQGVNGVVMIRSDELLDWMARHDRHPVRRFRRGVQNA